MRWRRAAARARSRARYEIWRKTVRRNVSIASPRRQPRTSLLPGTVEQCFGRNKKKDDMAKTCKIKTITHFTSDMKEVKNLITGLAWPQGSTLTSLALMTAKQSCPWVARCQASRRSNHRWQTIELQVHRHCLTAIEEGCSPCVGSCHQICATGAD